MARRLLLVLATACGEENHLEGVKLKECAVADAFVQLRALDTAMVGSDGSAAAAASLAIEHNLHVMFGGVPTCTPRVASPDETVTSSCMPEACDFTITWTSSTGTAHTASGSAVRMAGHLEMTLRTNPPTDVDFRESTRVSTILPVPVAGEAMSSDGVVNQRSFTWRDIEVDADGCPIAGTFEATWYFLNHSDYPDYGKTGSLRFGARCAR